MRRDVRATKPALIGATVREAPHCARPDIRRGQLWPGADKGRTLRLTLCYTLSAHQESCTETGSIIPPWLCGKLEGARLLTAQEHDARC